MNSYFEHASERLYYRRLSAEHIQPWEAFFVNNQRLHFIGLDGSKSNAEYSKEWIERQEERYATTGVGMLGVFKKDTDELIGFCGIIDRDYLNQKVYEIGYSFMENHWGKGYATEAAMHFKKIGIELGISPYYVSMIHPDNHDSMKVAERNGMKPLTEGVYNEMPVIIFGDEKALVIE